MEVPPIALVAVPLAVWLIVGSILARRTAHRDVDRLLAGEPEIRRANAWLSSRTGPPEGRTRGPGVLCLTATRLVFRMSVPALMLEVPLRSIRGVSLTTYVPSRKPSTRPLLLVQASRDGVELSLTIAVLEPARWIEAIEERSSVTSDDADLAKLVESQLRGSGTWDDRHDHSVVDGLERAVKEAGPRAPAFARVLIAALSHADVRIRAGAVLVLPTLGAHVTGDQLVRVLEADPGRFRGVAWPDGFPANGKDVETGLIIALRRIATRTDVATIAYLKQRAGEASTGRDAVFSLANLEPDWIAEHAARVVPREAICGVLRSLGERGCREAVVRALSPWPGEHAQALVTSKPWTTLELADDEKQVLTALVLGEPRI